MYVWPICPGVLHLHNVWTAPLETLAIIALLLSITQGVYGLPSLLILLAGLPLQCEGLAVCALCMELVSGDGMFVYMHVSMLVCVCVYAFARACAYVHVCVLVHVYVYLRMPLYVSACANIVSSCGSASATGAAALGALVAQRVWLVGHVLACACRACACMTLHLMLQEVLAW